MVCRTIIDRPAFSGNLSVFRAENAGRSLGDTGTKSPRVDIIELFHHFSQRFECVGLFSNVLFVDRFL